MKKSLLKRALKPVALALPTLLCVNAVAAWVDASWINGSTPPWSGSASTASGVTVAQYSGTQITVYYYEAGYKTGYGWLYPTPLNSTSTDYMILSEDWGGVTDITEGESCIYQDGSHGAAGVLWAQ